MTEGAARYLRVMRFDPHDDFVQVVPVFGKRDQDVFNVTSAIGGGTVFNAKGVWKKGHPQKWLDEFMRSFLVKHKFAYKHVWK